MSLSINQNIMAMNSYRNLSNTQGSLSKSLEKLSSGFRINRAADDAAGLSISEGLRTQVNGNKQAQRNAQDGISLVQTAEGALNEVHDMLQRMRTLTVQGANDSNNTDARNAINKELNALKEEIGRIGKVTEFNGTKLLDGAQNGTDSMMFQVGSRGNQDNAIAVKYGDLKTVVEGLKNIGTKPAEAGDVKANVQTVETFAKAADFKIGNETIDLSGVADVDAAVTAINAKKDDTGVTASKNGEGKLVLTGKADGTSFTASGTGMDIKETTKGVKLGDPVAVTKDHASFQEATGLIDAQITAVSDLRSDFGAVQNRFEHTIKNLGVAVENLSASEARIRDTDMADEMMQFTRNQILSQAGTSMLAQANQVPQGVLSLLR